MSSRALVVVAVASLVATLLAGVAPALAAHDGPGDLDATFADDGTITTNVTGEVDEAYAMAVQDDGKIVLAGDAETDAEGTDGEFMAVARLNADGSLDTSFGDGGSVLINFGIEERVNAVAVQDDGRIVLAGVAGFGSDPPPGFVAFSDFIALVRLTEDGLLDSSFRGGAIGVAPTGDFNDDSAAHGVAVDTAGNIVAVGSADGQTAVIRTEPDGDMDAGFDSDGTVLVDVAAASTSEAANAVVLDGAGRIVMAGHAGASATLLRVMPNGSLDTGFGGGDGIVTTPVDGGVLRANAVALDPGGEIVSAGFLDPVSADGTQDYLTAVLRHTDAGVPDNTFDDDGQATIEIGEDRRDQAFAVGVEADGAVVTGGWVSTASSGSDFALARLNADGTPDAGFGDAGVVITQVSTGNDELYGLALREVGGETAVVTAGFSLQTGTDFTAARYDADGGLLDADFGQGDGIAPVGVGTGDDRGRAAALQPDGKLLVANERFDEAVLRYLPDGSLDAGFGNGGVVGRDAVTVPSPRAVLLQPDGKIVVGGDSNLAFVAQRLEGDGATDTSYGTGGMASATFAGDEAANDAALTPDGATVVAGFADNDSGDPAFALVRFTSDGELDPAFGDGGRVVTPIGDRAVATAVVVTDDGRIVVAGGSGPNFAVARYSAAGVLDPTFDTDGIVTGRIDEFANVADVALQADGKILLAGDRLFGGQRLGVLRLNADGSPDTGFGGDGLALAPFAGDAAGRSVAVQPNGRIVVVGWEESGEETRSFALARFEPDGSLDDSFGNAGDGTQTTPFSGDGAEAEAVVLQPNDGKIIAVGTAMAPLRGADVAVARYQGDAPARLTVNSTGDGDDADPGDQTCDTGGTVGDEPECTLRAAIQQANATEGEQIIAFDIGEGGLATIAPASPLPTIDDPVTIDGTTQSGWVDDPIIEVDGTSAGIAHGLLLVGAAAGSTIRGLVINNFAADGIHINDADGAVIAGNWIGVDADGITALGNGDDGLDARQGANDTTVVDNVISGNGGDGLAFLDGTGTTVLGNHVGVDAAGTTGVGNGDDGILFLRYDDVVIGGPVGGEGNVIADNGEDGVQAQTTSDLVIQGNFVGVDATGNTPLGNVGEGMILDGHASDNATGIVVGGAAAGEGNVIGDNGEQGIQVEEATGTVVQGNHIGVGADGVSDVGNAKEGIVLHGQSDGTVVGGTEAGAANVIAGNGGHGVHARAFHDEDGRPVPPPSLDNQVIGNRIGLDGAGEPMGNEGDGVHIADDSTGNTILGNEISASGGLGIDLAGDGVTANDGPGDADSGPNGLQNFPVIDTATVTLDGVRVVGQLDSEPNESFTLEFFANAACDPSDHGEGARPLATMPVQTNGDGIAEFDETLDADAEAGEQITATATSDTDGNTSEFSACRTAAATDGPPDPDPGDDDDGGGGGGGGGGGTPAARDCPEPTQDSVTCELGSDGGTTSTGGEQADEGNPIITTVTTPNGGTVAIDEASDSDGDGLPAGFDVLDLSVDINAPVASADNPLIVTFRVDGSRVPDGHDATTVEVFRDGAFVPDCEAAPPAGEAADPDGQPAAPDPCVFTRVQDGDDTVLTVLTSQASIWTFAVAVDACIVDLVPDAGFGDVPGDNVHRLSVDCLVWHDIARGVTARRFAPGKDVTRAQIASFVTQMIESTGVELPPGVDAFDDDNGSIHHDNINKLAAAGLVKGTTTTRYAPNETVSRAQMATMLVNAATYVTGSDVEATRDYFSDDQRSLHEDNINRAREAGFTAGVTTTTYAPYTSVRRDQMASFLVNVMDLFIAEGLTTIPD